MSDVGGVVLEGPGGACTCVASVVCSLFIRGQKTVLWPRWVRGTSSLERPQRLWDFRPPCPAEVVWAEGIWLAALPCHCWEEGLLPEPGKPRVGWVALEHCTGRTPNAWLRSSTQPCAAV